MENLPLVSIICTSYNHEAYIKEALEGFVMQKTNFPFEIIVHDDASTDNTASIVKSYEVKYPELFVNIYQTENQYSKGNGDVGRIVYGAARGKYIAICEGDDYWSDPLKLQKQVDFLEKNEGYGVVFTDADHLIQRTGKLIKSYDRKHGCKILTGDIFKELLYRSPFKTCTSLFRLKLLDDMDYPFLRNEKFLMGDRILWLHIAAKSKIGYISESTAIYRVMEISASNFDNINGYISFYESSNRLAKCFALHYGVPIDEKYQKSQLNWLITARYMNMGNYKLALKCSDSYLQLVKIFIKEKIARNVLNKF